MDLDDNLKEILTDVRNEYEVSDDAVAQIKQAFEEAGWTPDEDDFIPASPFKEVGSGTARSMMTGQAWYDNFVDSLTDGNPEDIERASFPYKIILEAAKKASSQIPEPNALEKALIAEEKELRG